MVINLEFVFLKTTITNSKLGEFVFLKTTISAVDWWISELCAWCGEFRQTMGMSEREKVTGRRVVFLRNTTEVRTTILRLV
jgi:hypothetical protein